MPIVGTLDSERAQRITEDLLAGIEHERSHIAIMDITGLAVVDTAVAQALLQASQAARLLGAQPILVGITPEVAETVVQLGVDLHNLQTAATLQEGLRLASRMLRQYYAASPTAQ
jgi:rsbT co-antagonist protein RsbR